MANTQILLGFHRPGLTAKESREWHRLLESENGDDKRFWELEAQINAAPQPQLMAYGLCSNCGTDYKAPVDYPHKNIQCGCGVTVQNSIAARP